MAEPCASCGTDGQVTWCPAFRVYLCPACREIRTVRELCGDLAAAMDGAS